MVEGYTCRPMVVKTPFFLDFTMQVQLVKPPLKLETWLSLLVGFGQVSHLGWIVTFSKDIQEKAGQSTHA